MLSQEVLYFFLSHTTRMACLGVEAEVAAAQLQWGLLISQYPQASLNMHGFAYSGVKGIATHTALIIVFPN